MYTTVSKEMSLVLKNLLQWIEHTCSATVLLHMVAGKVGWLKSWRSQMLLMGMLFPANTFNHQIEPLGY